MKHTRHMDLEKASNLKLPWPDYFLSGVSGQQIASGYLWIGTLDSAERQWCREGH